MKNKFIKTLSLFMSCLALTLLLNVTTTDNSSKLLTAIASPDEWVPWG